ncbi:hypothetical protein NM74_07945 [Aeromonas hydrophila]|uniref:hypothetical protein n=1 Tax=Aeromonas hydrophila TaxID=644 RepID=UPI000538E6B1|nr:hypothetical protein [Aeromonas hydrophila]KHA57140.1 hypothetical protein NM74_07945 [Aeromonas hydrophila]
MIDATKARRESMRWYIMLTLNTSRPVDPTEVLVLSTVQGVIPDATAAELRREMDYLADRSIVTLDKLPHGMWVAGLTSLGVDIVEYTVDCRPGIARPVKYWGGE